tara:strand:+ start:22637 stop:23920 length:1284 start_codon:yes stop_codon:yes gene_type:complete
MPLLGRITDVYFNESEFAMNRVRVVAVTAVALGVAVFAGTKFQDSRGLVSLGEEPSAQSQTPQAMGPQSNAQAQAQAQADVESLVSMARTQMAATDQPLPDQPLPSDASVALAQGDALAQSLAQSPAQSLALAQASILPGVDIQATDGESKDGDLAAAENTLAQGLSQQPPAAPVPFQPTRTPAGDALTPVAPLDAEMQAELSACAVWLVVTPSVGGMLDASVYAPCDRDAQVQISHAGLTFDTRIGEDGQLVQMVPALAVDATITLTFADGRTQSDTTLVSDLGSLDRVALQWESPATLQLHAYEFGAQYGEPGHIFAGNPLAPGEQGYGFMTVLGDPAIPGGRMAQVYSYPSGQSARTGSVSLEIEAPVTDQSCGRPIEAQSIELQANGLAQTRTINLDMPACDGAGGYVVIPGVLPDIQVASLN